MESEEQKHRVRCVLYTALAGGRAAAGRLVGMMDLYLSILDPKCLTESNEVRERAQRRHCTRVLLCKFFGFPTGIC